MKRAENVLTLLRTTPLHWRLVGAIALVLAASLGQSYFTYQAMVDNTAAAGRVQRTESILALASDTRAALLEMESDYRAFLIDGDEEFMAPYAAARELYLTNLEEVEQLSANDPAEVARWEQLGQRAETWLHEVVEPDIALRRSASNLASGGQTPPHVSLNQSGALTHDEIEHLLSEATGSQQALLEQRREKNVSTNALLLQELARGTLAVIAVGLLVAIIYSRNVKQALTKVRSGERRYRQMFENNPSAKILVNPTTGAIIEANGAACDFYGYSHADMLQKGISDIDALAPDTTFAHLAGIAGDGHRSVTAVHRLASGALRDVAIRASLIDISEDVRGHSLFYAVITDVTERKQAEAESRFHTSLLQAQGEASPDGILAMALDGRVLSFNRRFTELWRVPEGTLVTGSSGHTALGVLLEQLDQPEAFLTRLAYLTTHPKEHSHEELALRDARIFDSHSAPVRGPDGAFYGRVWFIRDITERKHAEAAAQSAREFLAGILESVGAGILACDSAGRLTLSNEATRTLLGLPESSLPADEWIEHFALYEADGTTFLPADQVPLSRALRGEQVHNAEMMIVPKHGLARTVVVDGRALRDANGRAVGAVVAMHDISERKRAEEALRHLALHDDLTELPNRTLLQDCVAQAIVTCQCEGEPLSLLLIDLDRFKEINDTFGHRYGDLLLQQIGARLQSVLPTSDTIARLGGDEFGVLLPRTDGTRAAAVGKLLLQALAAPFVVEGQLLEIAGSVGVSSYPTHGRDVATLLRQADVAMYVAKRAQCGVAIYAAEHDHHSADRLALGSELRVAIETNELMLRYQPKVDLTGRLVGVEALVRWHHPQRGIIRPDEFVGLAEHVGLIKPLTRWVLDAALRQCRTWLERGTPIRIAINVSMHDLHDDTLPDTVTRRLAQYGVPGEYLGIEITEGAIMSDAGRALAVLTRLRALGVRISVDDFGTGYSSLSYLKQLPVQELKIDRSLVHDIAIDEDDAAIVRSTIGLGHELGLTVVAEGVDSQACWEGLRQFGCDQAQGFFVAQPLSPADLQSWLNDTGQFRANWKQAA